jgi:hypothetical protein
MELRCRHLCRKVSSVKALWIDLGSAQARPVRRVDYAILIKGFAVKPQDSFSALTNTSTSTVMISYVC